MFNTAPIDERFKIEITERLDYALACTGSVEFRTNGLQGGDAGHGGYLEIRINTKSRSTTLDATVDGREIRDAGVVTLTFRGDNEMVAAAHALEFLGSRLKPMLDQSLVNSICVDGV